ncbi:MAG: hypothetical protein ACTHZ1_07570 [Sphingobacterium sp.]
MRKIVAICLLLIYSVCSTGATIYLHHCGKNTIVSVLDKQKSSHDSCPMCVEQSQNNSESNDRRSHHDECQDVHVSLDLKAETEQPQPNWLFGKLFDLSPSIVLLPWILTHLELGTIEYTPVPPASQPLAVSDVQGTYLINCSFRI